MFSLRIPKKAISQNGLNPSYQKNAPKRNPHQPPPSSSSKYHANSNQSTIHKSTQNRRLLLRKHDDDSSDDDDFDLNDTNDTNTDNDTDSNIDSVTDMKPRKLSKHNDSDSDSDIDMKPRKTKILSFTSSQRFRSEHDLGPKKKRRKTNAKSIDNEHIKPIVKKRKTKVRSCAICATEIHKDNHGKYCGETCKKEGRTRNKEERAERKKQKEQEQEEELFHKEKKHKVNMRKNTASKFGEIFKDENAGNNLEKRIYKASGNELNDKYLEKAKDLAYNLEKNKELLQRVFSGEVTLKQLSQMSNDELAPKDLVLSRKQRDEKFKKENTLQKKMVFGKVMDGHYMAQPEDVDRVDDNDIKDKTPSPTPISTVNSVDVNSVDVDSVDTVTKRVFDANEMTEILKNCKGKVAEDMVNVGDDEPLKIQRDSSEDEDEDQDEDEDEMEMSVPEPPPVLQYLKNKRGTKEKRSRRNVWNGTIRKSSNDKSFGLSLCRIGGKDIKLKCVIPKHLQINGRTKFKMISGCLKDLVKVTKSKFTIILSAKCEDKYSREYRDIMKECRASKKGFVIDMKQTKAKIKMILLPSFMSKNEEEFNAVLLEKLWKCSLPKTEDLWALLTVYTKEDKDKIKTKQKYIENTKSKGNDKYVQNGHTSGNGDVDKDRERYNGSSSRNSDKYGHRNRDIESDEYKDNEKRRSNGYDKHDRQYHHQERDRDRNKGKSYYGDRERNREIDRDRDRNRDKGYYGDDRYKSKSRTSRYKRDDKRRNHTSTHSSPGSK